MAALSSAAVAYSGSDQNTTARDPLLGNTEPATSDAGSTPPDSGDTSGNAWGVPGAEPIPNAPVGQPDTLQPIPNAPIGEQPNLEPIKASPSASDITLGREQGPQTYSAPVERWRGLVSKYFPPNLVDKMLYVIDKESGGNPDAKNPESGAEGLVQGLGHPGYDFYDPETAIKWAATQVKDHGWTDWGEGVTYQGKPFGALGLYPYQGGGDSNTEPSAGGASVGSAVGRIAAPFVERANDQAVQDYKLKQGSEDAWNTAPMQDYENPDIVPAGSSVQPSDMATTGQEQNALLQIAQTRSNLRDQVQAGSISPEAAETQYQQAIGLITGATAAGQADSADLRTEEEQDQQDPYSRPTALDILRQKRAAAGKSSSGYGKLALGTLATLGLGALLLPGAAGEAALGGGLASLPGAGFIARQIPAVIGSQLVQKAPGFHSLPEPAQQAAELAPFFFGGEGAPLTQAAKLAATVGGGEALKAAAPLAGVSPNLAEFAGQAGAGLLSETAPGAIESLLNTEPAQRGAMAIAGRALESDSPTATRIAKRALDITGAPAPIAGGAPLEGEAGNTAPPVAPALLGHDTATAAPESIGNQFVAPLRPFEDVQSRVEGLSDNRLVGAAQQVLAHSGINPSLVDDSPVGKAITTYAQQRAAGLSSTEAALQGALDVHAEPFSGKMSTALPIDRDGMLTDSAGVKAPWQDVFSEPGKFALSPATQAYVQDFQQVIAEGTRMMEDAGIHVPKLAERDGWSYVPRQVEGIEDMDLTRRSNSFLQRVHEDAAEGVANGVRYSTDPRATAQIYLNAAYRAVADTQLKDALEPLSVGPNALVPQSIKDRLVAAIENQRSAASGVRQQSYEGIKLSQAGVDADVHEAQVRLDTATRNATRLQGELTGRRQLATGQRQTPLRYGPEMRAAQEEISNAKVQLANAQGAQRNVPKGIGDAQAYVSPEAKAAHNAAISEYAAAKNAYTKAMETARQSSYGPGSLFGYQENDIPLGQWRNRFFPEADAQALKDGIDRVTQQNPVTKTITQGVNLGRFAGTMADFGSAPFIQGLPTLARNPVAWARATALHYATLVNPRAIAAYVRENQDIIGRMTTHNIPVGDSEFFQAAEKSKGLPLGKPLEYVPTPGGGNLREVAQNIGQQTVGRSRTSYGSFLTVARTELAKAVESGGGDLAENAQWIRNATGGLDPAALGVTPNQQTVEGLWLAFAPRLLRSTSALMTDAVRGAAGLAVPGMEASVSQKNSLRTVTSLMAGATAMYYGVGQALGKSKEEIETGLNPLSGKKFMSYQVGGDWIGVGGLVRGLTQFAANAVATTANHPADWATIGRSNPLINFYLSRSAPAYQMAANAIDAASKNHLNPYQQINGPIDYFKQLGMSYTPFIAQTMLEGGDWKQALATGLGARSSPETPNERRDNLVAEGGFKNPTSGAPITKYNDLFPDQRRSFDATPEAQKIATDKGPSPYKVQSTAAHAPTIAERNQEEDLWSRGLNNKKLSDVYHTFSDENRGIAQTLEPEFAKEFAGFNKTKFDSAVDGYYKTVVNIPTAEQTPGEGTIDFDATAAARQDFLDKLPADEKEWVTEALNVSEANKSDTQKSYDKYIADKKAAGYFDIQPGDPQAAAKRVALDKAHPDLDVASWKYNSVAGKAGAALNSTTAVDMALRDPASQHTQVKFQSLPRPINENAGTLAAWNQKDSYGRTMGQRVQDYMDYYPHNAQFQQILAGARDPEAENKFSKPYAQLEQWQRKSVDESLNTYMREAAREMSPDLDAYLAWSGAEKTLSPYTAATDQLQKLRKDNGHEPVDPEKGPIRYRQ